MSYLSGDYLLGSAGGYFRYIVPAIIFFPMMAMAGTLFAYYIGQVNNKRAPITRMANRVQTIGWTIAIIGLVIVAFRWGDAHIPLVSTRLAMYVAALAFAVLAGYVVYFIRVVLPQKDAAYQQTQLRRQYQPRARRRRS